MDTDSFLHQIEAEDFYKDIGKDVDFEKICHEWIFKR